jgi:hypothetical protein
MLVAWQDLSGRVVVGIGACFFFYRPSTYEINETNILTNPPSCTR